MIKVKFAFFFLLLILNAACDNRRLMRNRAVAVSISSDGQYVLSAHEGHTLVLWDIKHKTKKTLNQRANFYSPYFIKGRHLFMWQDNIDNTVYIEHVSGKIVKKINPDIKVATHVITPDLKSYILADENYSILEIKNNQKTLLRKGFGNYGKSLHLSLNKNLMLSSGECDLKGEDLPVYPELTAKAHFKWQHNYDYTLMPCITLYDIEKRSAIKKFSGGHAGKTVTALSRLNDFFISGDENTIAYLWNIKKAKQIFELDNLFYGKDLGICENGLHCNWDDTGLIKPPKDFKRCYTPQSCVDKSSINALKFIAKDQYLRFTTGVPYAILYDLLDPKPKKYFSLRTKPKVFVYGYGTEQSIDTAPEAGILVMTQTGNPDPNDQKGVNYFGINVFKYDRAKQTLKLIWSPKGPPAYREPKQTNHAEDLP